MHVNELSELIVVFFETFLKTTRVKMKLTKIIWGSLNERLRCFYRFRLIW